MRRLNRILSGSAIAAIGAGGLWFSGVAPISAADHFDPPTRTDQSVNPNADLPADLADLYLYHTATSVIVSIDFAGPRPPNEPARYDRDVLYNIMLSNAGSKVDPEFTLDIRFGQDATNPAASGFRIAGLPGLSAPVVGPVESIVTTSNGIRIFAGLIDDPFNFDPVGLRLTRESGTLMFNNQRNRFAQMNSTAVIIEIPLALIRNGDNRITSWATAARISPGA
jgi:hypothetical protein